MLGVLGQRPKRGRGGYTNFFLTHTTEFSIKGSRFEANGRFIAEKTNMITQKKAL